MGKRFKKNSKTNKILKLCIILIFIYVIYNFIYVTQKEANIKIKSEEIQKIEYETNIENYKAQKNKEIIPEEYEGYKVAAFIEIPSINLQTFVLDDISRIKHMCI